MRIHAVFINPVTQSVIPFFADEKQAGLWMEGGVGRMHCKEGVDIVLCFSERLWDDKGGVQRWAEWFETRAARA